MPRISLALLLIVGLVGCQKTVDPWSAATLLTHLSDTRSTLECVPDPLLTLRTLRPELEQIGEMPSDHKCRRDLNECLSETKKNFCGSALEQKLSADSHNFRSE